MRRFAVLSPLFVSFVMSGCSHAQRLEFGLDRLKAPAGFKIGVFAETPSPRMMVFSPGGTLLVSGTDEGVVVALPDARHTGRADRVVTVLNGLNDPHGLAFEGGKLYVAENDKVARYDWDEAQLRASNGKVLTDLPSRGGATAHAPSSSSTAKCLSRPVRVATFVSRATSAAPPSCNSIPTAAT
jgi:glucose/arabinose dehydrogenase